MVVIDSIVYDRERNAGAGEVGDGTKLEISHIVVRITAANGTRSSCVVARY